MGRASRLRSIFNAPDWGSAKGMYNYSLMNNSSGLLLINHTRSNVATGSRRDKHASKRTDTHLYIIVTTNRQTVSQEVPVHVCPSFIKHMCVHAKHALTQFSWETGDG